jgi:hypothetical protein
MILSSDKLSGLGKPVVQLKLDTSAGDSSVVQEHLLELDLKEITALVKVLKNAQTVRFFFQCLQYLTISARLKRIPHFTHAQAAQVK